MLRRRRSVAPRTNACAKENAHPESDRTTTDDTNFRRVNAMKMLPYQEVKSGLETVLLPPRSAVTPVKLNPPMKSSKLWSPTIENDRPTGIKVNAKYNTQLHESLEGSPRKRILPHANPDQSSQHVEGPVAALKLMFDNVVAAIKHAFSKEDSNTINGQDPDDVNKGIRNDSHDIRVPRSKRKRSNLRGLPSPEPKRKQSLEVIGPHQASFTNRIFPGSSMVSPSSLVGMEVGSPLSCGTASSPTFRKIRNPLLRSYYCLSPVAKRVDFSSLRIDTSSNSQTEESSENNRKDESLSFTEVKSPAAPPSNPPPAPPPPPPPPPPVPSLSRKLTKCTTQVPMTSSDNVHGNQGGSKVILRDMQQRLRSRMRKQMHTGPDKISEKENQSNRADLMYLQWIEIQAHKMKMKPQEIKILAEKKQAELCDLLKSLKTITFTTHEEVSTFIESYQEGLTWFPGCTKELKSMTNDDVNYANLESRIDVMTEYVHIMADMSAVIAECRGVQKGICMASPTVRIQRTLDEYKQRDRLWGPILLSQGRLWKVNNLPFEPQCIKDGTDHLLQLALRLARCVSDESENIRGLLVSFGCTRTNKVKSFLHQTLEVLLECTKYVHCPESSVSLSLQESASSLASSHLRISCDQYEGFVYLAGQQIVCAHFEENLKILSRMKEIVRKIYGLGHLSSGYIDYLPASENLVAQINRSCNLLLKHVQTSVNQTLSALEEIDLRKSAHSYKEMICWMIFSCKYAERNLEMLGNREEEKMSGLQELLEGLQTLEAMLGST